MADQPPQSWAVRSSALPPLPESTPEKAHPRPAGLAGSGRPTRQPTTDW